MKTTARSIQPASNLVPLVLAAASMIFTACSHEASGSYVASGTTLEAGAVKITAAGVDSRTGQRAIVFGVTEVPGRRSYSYVVVARPKGEGPGVYSASSQGGAEMSGGSYSAKHTFGLGGSSLNIRHTASILPQEDGITDEALILQGKEVDLSKGRLFLIDEWAAMGGWTQLPTPLPGVVGAVEDQPALTRAMVDALAESTPELAALLED